MKCQKTRTHKTRGQAVKHREELVAKQLGLRNIAIYSCSEHGGLHVGRERIPMRSRPRGRIKR